jgi:hypothetical protein
MSDPVRISRGNHIGGHEIVEEIGPVRVHPDDYSGTERVEKEMGFGRLIFDTAATIATYGCYLLFRPNRSHSFVDEMACKEVLKDEASKMGGNGIIDAQWERGGGKGVVVRVE